MPIYDIDIPGMGQFQVESETELDDSEVINQLTAQLGNNPELNPTKQLDPPSLPSMTQAANAGAGGRVRDPTNIVN